MSLDELFEEALDDESAEDAKEVVDNTDLSDLDPHEDDAPMLHVLHPEAAAEADEGDEDKDEDEPLDEGRVLSIPTRIKMGQRMKRLAKRYAMLRKMKAKRMAPLDRLQYRARKAALLAIRRRIGGKADRKFSELSPQQKMSIDRMVAQRYPGAKLNKTVALLSKRFLPLIRKKEMARLEKARHHDDVQELHVYGPGETHKVKKTSKRFTSKELDWTAIGSKKNGVHDPLSRDNKETTGMVPKDGNKSDEINNPYSMFNLGDKRRSDVKREVTEARKSAHGGADAGDEGDTHIIAQLQKAAISRGEHHHVQWGDGSKSQVHPQHAKMALTKWQSIMRGSGPGHFTKDKMNLLKKLGSDENSFYDAIGLSEGKAEPVRSKGKYSIKKLPQDTRADNPYGNSNQSFTKGPGPGAISPYNTFGEETALSDRRSMIQSRKIPTPPAQPNKLIPPPRRQAGTVAVGGSTQPTPSSRLNGARRGGQTNHRFFAHGAPRNRIMEDKLPPEVRARVGDLRHLASDPLKRLRNVAQRKIDAGDHNSDLHQHTIAAVNHLLKKKRIEENFAKKAEKYDIPIEIIEEVYERGLEEGGEESAFNRVNSFINGGFAAELDDDLVEMIKTVKVREYGGGFHYAVIGKKPRRKTKRPVNQQTQIKRLQKKNRYRQMGYNINETGGAGELGTPELTNTYAAATPGQGTEVNMTPAPFSAPKPWENEDIEKREDSKSPKTYQEVRKALQGLREEGEGFSYHPNQDMEDDDNGDMPSMHAADEFDEDDPYMQQYKRRRWHHHRIDDV